MCGGGRDRRAIKASGVIVSVEPADFVGILKRQPGALVVHATGWLFGVNYQYLMSYKGLAFFTEAPSPLEPASGHGAGAGQGDLDTGGKPKRGQRKPKGSRKGESVDYD